MTKFPAVLVPILLQLVLQIFILLNHSEATSAFIVTSPSPPREASLLNALKLPDWVPTLTPKATKPSTENGLDEEYPWCFTGRLWFRPAIVRLENQPVDSLVAQNDKIVILHLFGYTLGGTVALEYETSPVGPYREYVTMGALTASAKNGGMIGQWGSRLYVSNKVAEDICQEVWGVPAEVADIDFVESNSNKLQVTSAPSPIMAASGQKPTIQVTGWSQTRSSAPDAPVRGGLSIWWTPTLKALWLRFLPTPVQQSSSADSNDKVPLHKLRLSASSLRLQWCGQESSDFLGFPLGIGLSVDNVLIEIGRKEGVL